MTDNICGAKDLIKKSIHLATICKNCKDEEKEKRLWKIACSYITKAKELVPEEEWFQVFTTLELQCLQNGFPHPMQISFFEDDENQQYLPPVPSEWDNINNLKSQIKHLEDEKRKIEEYTNRMDLQRRQYERLEKKHNLFMEKAEKEQYQLQQEMKVILKNQEENAQILLLASQSKNELQELRENSTFMEKEINRLKEKIASIYDKNRQEMTRLNLELDSAHYNIESISDELQTTRTSLTKILEQNQKLQQNIKSLEHDKNELSDHIQSYQAICKILIPSLNDFQQELLKDVLSKMETLSHI